MKHILLDRIKIQNFLSIGNEPVKIDFKPGVNIITGSNKDKPHRANMIGKSSVSDAVHFGFFGQPIRNIKKENVVNHINNKTCQVDLKFIIKEGQQTTEYNIIRTVNPNKCKLFINGKDETRSTLPKTNQLISDIIDSNPEVFQNSIIMTLNNTIPFMSQSKVNKRKFIEGILNLEIFSNMLLQARQEYNELKKQFDIENTKCGEIEKTLEVYKEQKQTFEKNKKEKIQNLRNRKKENENEIKELKKEFVKNIKEKINKTEEQLKKIEEFIEKNNENISEVEKNIYKKTISIKNISDEINKHLSLEDKCPTCGYIMKDHDKEKHKKQINDLKNKKQEEEKEQIELKNKKQTLFDKKDKLLKTVTQIKNNLEQNKKTQQNNDYIVNKASQIKKYITQIDEDIENIKNEPNQIDNELNKVQDRYNVIVDETQKLRKKLSIIDVVKFIVSEEGVKSFIVKRILQLLNSKLAYYLNKMDAPCIVKFNEYFEETIINDKGIECSYHNFSGAERKSIDLACLFTFADIRRIQGVVDLNISMYDELFDSSFDAKGVELVLDILKERAKKYNECVYVISHRKESIKAATGEVIFLEKRNGITTRVPYQQLTTNAI